MSGVSVLSIPELLAEDPAYPAWLKRNTLTPPAWKTCCHEAAHCVAALVLLGTPAVRAYIFTGRDGATFVPPSGGFNRAVLIAAGDAGAALAERNPPPSGGPSYFECDAAFEMAEAAPTDDVRMREWRGDRDTSAPSRKAVRRRAALFVREHRQKILETAAWLYQHGSGQFSLPNVESYREAQ